MSSFLKAPEVIELVFDKRIRRELYYSKLLFRVKFVHTFLIDALAMLGFKVRNIPDSLYDNKHK